MKTENSRNFDQRNIKYELQDLIQGKSKNSAGGLIGKVAAYLRGSEETSRSNEGKERSKEEEAADLTGFIDSNNFWYREPICEENKIGEGAEQKVYYNPEKGTVIKLNDAIFFLSWKDYLDNLLLHNYFFPDTGYTLQGFKIINDTLFAAVEQTHIQRTEDVNLEKVRDFLIGNGFEHTRNNDYHHKELGIILEDLHDENVISSDVILFFIDTVFYLTEDFYKSPQ